MLQVSADLLMQICPECNLNNTLTACNCIHYGFHRLYSVFTIHPAHRLKHRAIIGTWFWLLKLRQDEGVVANSYASWEKR
jgi:hypothetical protein